MSCRCRGNRQILITEPSMKKFLCFAALSLTMLAFPARADSLQDCSDQFIDRDINNAPTLYDGDPTQSYGNNVHLCFRDGNMSFFALEYWPEEFSPRWVAYRLDPANYGEDGCNTFTRAVGNCYINAPTWQEALDCDIDNYKGDPFHADHMLKDPKLGSNPFSNTGHDRGHIAPRAAFSWHVCGNYQTFSMANMSPQRAYLYRQIWPL